MHSEQSFRFADDDLNGRLIALLKKNRIRHAVDKRGVIHYSADDEETVENDLIGRIRKRAFPSWQVLSFPREWADTYRHYMMHHRIPFTEEWSNGELSFLLPRRYRPHQWKLESDSTLESDGPHLKVLPA